MSTLRVVESLNGISVSIYVICGSVSSCLPRLNTGTGSGSGSGTTGLETEGGWVELVSCILDLAS